MSALPPEHPRPRVGPGRSQVHHDAQTAALHYGLEAIGQKLNELAVQQFQSLSGVMLRGARPVQVGTGGTVRAKTSPGSLFGWSLRNNGTSAALVYLRDGRDATGDLVAVIALNVGETTRDFAPGGITLSQGLYVDVNTGTIEGAVYLRGPE